LRTYFSTFWFEEKKENFSTYFETIFGLQQIFCLKYFKTIFYNFNYEGSYRFYLFCLFCNCCLVHTHNPWIISLIDRLADKNIIWSLLWLYMKFIKLGLEPRCFHLYNSRMSFKLTALNSNLLWYSINAYSVLLIFICLGTPHTYWDLLLLFIEIWSWKSYWDINLNKLWYFLIFYDHIFLSKFLNFNYLAILW